MINSLNSAESASARASGALMHVSVPVPCGNGPSASPQWVDGSSMWWIASIGPPQPPPHAWRRWLGSQPRQRMYEKMIFFVGRP